MAGLYQDDFVEALRRGLQGIAMEWGLPADVPVTLLNLSENATFLARPPDGPPVVLRVHRPGYHSAEEIASELDWLEALRAGGIVTTPAVLRLVSGGRIARFESGGALRHAVGFAFQPGREPHASEDLRARFRDLGRLSARLHAHARGWTPPAGFRRKTWDFDAMLGPRPLWGDWRAGLGLGPEGRALLEAVSARLQARLAAWGTGPGRFGLVHADLRLANLLVEADRIAVIDFDDCGFSWFLYDFAAAISFIEEDPAIPALQAAWIAGYRSLAPLGPEEKAMFPTFIMLRRLLLTAWIASHAETPTAQELGSAYTEGTLRLGRDYLSRA